MRRNNNSSLLLTVLGGAIFCFIFLGMAFIFTNSTSIMSGNNELPIVNNDVNLGDTDDGCNYTHTYTDGAWVCGIAPGDGYTTAGGGGSTQCQDDPSINLQGCGQCYREKVVASTTCSSCKAGYYRENNTCKKCEVGYKCPGDGTKVACGGYTYQDGVGQSSCKTCPQDTGYEIYNDVDTDTNYACKLTVASGWYVANPGERATLCPNGQSSIGGEISNGNTTQCLPCTNEAVATTGRCVSES